MSDRSAGRAGLVRGPGDDLGSVGDHEDASVATEILEGVEDDRLGLGVEVGGRLVEQDHGSVGDDGAGEGESGPLAR